MARRNSHSFAEAQAAATAAEEAVIKDMNGGRDIKRVERGPNCLRLWWKQDVTCKRFGLKWNIDSSGETTSVTPGLF